MYKLLMLLQLIIFDLLISPHLTRSTYLNKQSAGTEWCIREWGRNVDPAQRVAKRFPIDPAVLHSRRQSGPYQGQRPDTFAAFYPRSAISTR